jgi:hypothetical protein
MRKRTASNKFCSSGFLATVLVSGCAFSGCDSQQMETVRGGKPAAGQEALVPDELDGLIAKAEGLLLAANQVKDQQLAESLTVTVAKLKALKTETDPAKLVRIMAAITIEMQSVDSTLANRQRETNARVARLEEGYKTLEGAIAGLNENFNSTIAALESRLGDRIVQLGESLQRQVDALKSDYDTLEANFTLMDGVLDQLQALGLEELKEDWLANRTKFENFISSTNIEIEASKTRISALEAGHALQAEDIRSLRESDEEIAKKLEALKESTTARINEVRTELILRQDEKISSLQSQFNVLSATVSDLVKAAESLKELEQTVMDLARQAQSMRGEVDILNLAKDRAEVIAAIKARMEVALAWAALRTGHVDRVFCRNATSRALSMFDYRAANEANAFCSEKLAVLRNATVVIQTVKSILDGIAASNINDRCSLQFVPRAGAALEPAELLTDSDLASSTDLRNAVIRECGSGPVRVRALIIESLARLDVFPEHRTIRELRKMAPAARRYLIGSIAKFPETFDPLEFNTNPAISPVAADVIKTSYGSIERFFRESYIARRYRMPGDLETFPPTPGQIGPNPGEAVFSWADIKRDPGLESVEREEITNCSAAAMRSGLSNTLSLVKAEGSACFPYPSDPVASCPVNDDFALLRDPSRPELGAYVYEIFYQGLNEVVRPKIINGKHVTIGSGGSALSVRRVLGSANLPRSRWIAVTAPYSAFGAAFSHCQKFSLVDMMEHGVWVHPGEKDAAGKKISDGKSGFDRYLNGFEWSGAEETAVNPVFPAVSGGVTLPSNLHAKYLNSIAHSRGMPLAFYYDIARPVSPFDIVKPAGQWSKMDLAAFKDPSVADSRSLAAVQRVGQAPEGKIVSQLTSGGDYWGFGTVRYFGQSYTFNKTKPLYANTAAGSHSSAFIREQEVAAGIDVMDGMACESMKLANPFSVDVSGRKVIFERSKYHLIEGFGGRCTVDLVACASFKGQTVFGKRDNFYQNHLNVASRGPDGNLVESKGDRCELPAAPAPGGG